AGLEDGHDVSMPRPGPHHRLVSEARAATRIAAGIAIQHLQRDRIAELHVARGVDHAMPTRADDSADPKASDDVPFVQLVGWSRVGELVARLGSLRALLVRSS